MEEHAQNNMDSFFRDSLLDARQAPPEAVWNKIENELDNDDSRFVYVNNFRRVAAITGFLLILIGLSLFIEIQLRQIKSTASTSALNTKSALNTTLLKEIKSLHPMEKIRTGKKNLNNKAILLKNDNFLPSYAGHTDIYLTPINTDDLKLPLLNTDLKITFPGFPAGSNDKTVIKYQRQKFKERISVTPYFSKEFAGYNFTDEDSTNPGGKEIERRERNIFSASVGVYINYKLHKNWILQTGLSYSWSSTNIDSSTCYAVNDNNGHVQFKLNTISGYGYLQPSSAFQANIGDSLLAGKSYSQLHYLTIPLVISYNIPLKKFSLLVGGGVSFNLLTSASIETKTYGSGYPEKEYAINMMGLKKTNYGILVKADLQYHVSGNIGIDLIPSFRNTLSPINLRTAVSAYPYNFGIGVGLTYRLQ
jgi:Outer membrane protein beta-barrel domain